MNDVLIAEETDKEERMTGLDVAGKKVSVVGAARSGVAVAELCARTARASS
jgi:cation diffusion facilitator CzcD-associated flavoprotein CzcO